jgi:hypothetical protein
MVGLPCAMKNSRLEIGFAQFYNILSQRGLEWKNQHSREFGFMRQVLYL